MPHPLFEPIPQRLEIFLKSRNFSHQAKWKTWLNTIGAKIVLVDRWQSGEIFVLSESTLLTDDNRAVILTCGSAEPLRILDFIPNGELTGWRWSMFNPIHAHKTELSQHILQRWHSKGVRRAVFDGYESFSWGNSDSSITYEFNFSELCNPNAFQQVLQPSNFGLISMLDEHGLGYASSFDQSTQQIFEFEPHGLTLHFIQKQRQIFVHWSPEFAQLNLEIRLTDPSQSSLNALMFLKALGQIVETRQAAITKIQGETVDFHLIETGKRQPR